MRQYLFIGIIFVLCSVLGVAIFLLWQRWEGPSSASKGSSSSTQGGATISGHFDINGAVPEGATVTILSKSSHSDDKYETVATGLSAVDRNFWSFEEASGESYEVMANLVQGGNVVASTSPISVTAPASDEKLTFNIAAPSTTDDQQTPTSAPATVSGTVKVNGYIPTGALITIQARQAGEGQFQNVINNLPATRSQVVNYTNAVSGVSYEVVGNLFDGAGNKIGSSSPLVVSAPASHELLTINSQASAPTPAPQPTAAPSAPSPTPTPHASVAISGKIDFNGAAPENSRIVVFQRVHGTSQYTVAVDNVTPLDGTTWVWKGAKNATWYDMVAILKQRQNDGTDKDVADSQTITVASPASNEAFTINSGFSLPAPNGSMSITCGNRGGDNTWPATLSFESVDGAQSYWFQIGTSNGGSELLSKTANSSGNPLQNVNAKFNNGTTYYARYAYSEVANVPAGSQNFSSFSSTQSFVCN